MDDDYDVRLRNRLSALDTAVPAADGHGPRTLHRGRSVSVGTRLPFGLVAGLVVVIVGVAAAVGFGLRPSPAAGLPTSSHSPSRSGTVMTQPSMTSGMLISNAQGLPIPGSGNPVIVVATIANGTGSADKLLGASSPVAATGGLYGTSGGLTPAPGSTPADETGLAGFVPMQWWLIQANETIQLRAGAGKIVLNGLVGPLSAGQTIEVTFRFATSPPVTVRVPVVTTLADG